MVDRRLAVALAITLLPLAAAGEPSPERQATLLHRLKHDCGACHGITLKGGLGPPLRPADLAERADAELIEVVLEGRPGTPMPPWAFEISHDEAAWLIARLREGLDDGR
jgi:cytochrome c55X